MAVVVTHAFVSAIPDGADDTIVQPSDWNDDHEIAGLGSAAEADTGDFATAAQGAKADTAVQPAAIANMLETADIGVSVQGYSAVLAATTASFTTADETKLDGIATGATANATDAQLRDRATHTGTQSADTLTDGATNKAFLATERTKLAGIETGADVTDATNVAAAGAVMESDTSTASMSFVIDEDDMVSDSASKVPTQQSVKAYRDFIVSALKPGGRLTLTTGVAITTSDVAGATSIYYTPAAGDLIPVYNGTKFLARQFTELTLALDSDSGHTGYHQSAKIFDLFVINDAGTNRLATGPAWTSDTGRGTGAGTTELELLNGLWVNKIALAAARFGSASGNTVAVAARAGTYVGSFRAVANGQATDSKANRLLFNTYNQTLRPLRVTDHGSSWTHSLATWRQSNASTANQINLLLGLAGIAVQASAASLAVGDNATMRQVQTGIGLDVTNAPSDDSTTGAMGITNGAAVVSAAHYSGYPGLGYHYLAWLERGDGSGGVQTFVGDNAGTQAWKVGMTGAVLS